MPNPNGPYPGRQLFTGVTANGTPAFLYLVTGRSPASRERMAVLRDNTVIMGPIGNTPYDPLRHYTAIKYDNTSSILVVTNGIQTEAIFETYKLLNNVGTPPDARYIEQLMAGARSEPDSLNTPRISAVITKSDRGPLSYIAIVRHDLPAMAFPVTLEKGVLRGVSTYTGDIDNPAAYRVDEGLAKLAVKATTPGDMAQYLYDISAVTYKGDDIRVCAVGGLFQNDKWEIAVVNRYKS